MDIETASTLIACAAIIAIPVIQRVERRMSRIKAGDPIRIYGGSTLQLLKGGFYVFAKSASNGNHDRLRLVRDLTFLRPDCRA